MENLESTTKENSHSKVSVKVRCPECFKLFGVKAAEISESRPRFACTSCNTQFWVPFPECLEQEAMIGFPVSWLKSTPLGAASNLESTPSAPEPKLENNVEAPVAPAQAPFSCPKCNEPYYAEQKDCKKCGLIFSKFRLQESEGDVSASKEQKNRWQLVVDNYTDENVHQEFLRSCLKGENLEYAADRYQKMLKLNPLDDTAKKLHSEVMALSVAKVESHAPARQDLERRRKTLGTRLSHFVIVLSTMVIVIGYFVPELRNLTGLGAATLFFVVALKYYFKIF